MEEVTLSVSDERMWLRNHVDEELGDSSVLFSCFIDCCNCSLSEPLAPKKVCQNGSVFTSIWCDFFSPHLSAVQGHADWTVSGLRWVWPLCCPSSHQHYLLPKGAAGEKRTKEVFFFFLKEAHLEENSRLLSWFLSYLLQGLLFFAENTGLPISMYFDEPGRYACSLKKQR